MENDNNKQEQDQQRSQQGTGSAENRGDNREAQRGRHTVIGTAERQDIADQTGLKPGEVIDVQDTGGLSGRDDAAGGSGDDMTGASSGQPTEKF